MSFATDLWDGFEKVCERLETGLCAAHDYLSAFSKRQRIEEDYAKHVLDLSKTTPGSSKSPAVSKLEKTMRDALMQFGVSGQSLGQKHLEVSKKLLDDVVKPLDQSLRLLESDKKRVMNDGARSLKALKEAISGVMKTKEGYEKASKEYESVRDSCAKATEELKRVLDPKKVSAASSKIEQKQRQAREKVSSADVAYQAAVKAANELQSRVYHDQMPKVLEQLQKVYQEIFAATDKAVKAFAQSHSGLGAEYEAAREQMVEKMAKGVSYDRDLAQFINASKSDKSGPVPIQYVTFGGAEKEMTGSSSTTTTTTTTTAAATAASSSSFVREGEEGEGEEHQQSPVLEAPVATTAEAAPLTTTAGSPEAGATPPPALVPLEQKEEPSSQEASVHENPTYASSSKFFELVDGEVKSGDAIF